MTLDAQGCIIDPYFYSERTVRKIGKSKNLKPWEKGQSGNPEGRPKGSRNRSTIVREWLDANATDGEKGKVADQLVRALIQTALKGNVQAFRELMDSAYGKVSEKVDTSGPIVMMPSIKMRMNNGETKELTFNVGKPRKKD